MSWIEGYDYGYPLQPQREVRCVPVESLQSLRRRLNEFQKVAKELGETIYIAGVNMKHLAAVGKYHYWEKGEYITKTI